MMPRDDIEELQEENNVLKETVSYLEIVLKKAKERRNGDCKILAKKLLEVKPELEDWLKTRFGEYL